MAGLSQAKIESIVHFFPIILTQLFRIMCTNAYETDLPVDALTTIADLLLRVRSEQGGDTLIAQYIDYTFENVKVNNPPAMLDDASSPPVIVAPAVPVFRAMLTSWLSMLRLSSMGGQSAPSPEKAANYLLEIMFKSIVLVCTSYM